MWEKAAKSSSNGKPVAAQMEGEEQNREERLPNE
jgi:hypothetical protein